MSRSLRPTLPSALARRFLLAAGCGLAFAVAGCGGGGGGGGPATDPTPLAPIVTPSAVRVNDVGTGVTIHTGSAEGLMNSRAIAVDADGRIQVLWFDPATGLRHSRSLDGGATFLPSTLLVDVATAPVPSATVTCPQDHSGDVFVAYQDATDAVRCLRSSDGGRTWPAAGVVTGLHLRHGLGYSIAVSGDIVLVSEIPVARTARSTDRGATFTTDNNAVLANGLNCKTFAHPNEPSTFVVAGDLTYGYARKSTDGGVTWGTEVGPAPLGVPYSDYAMDHQGLVVGISELTPVILLDVGPMTFSLAAGELPYDDITWSHRTISADGDDVLWVVSNDAQVLNVRASYDSAGSFSKPTALDTGVVVVKCAPISAFPGVAVVYERDGAIWYQHN